MKVRKKILGFLFGLLFVVPAFGSQLTVTLTTNVLVQDVIPAGINISDTTYDAPMMKNRWEENFEGVQYRQCHYGIFFTNGFASSYVSTNQMAINGWNDLFTGASYTILTDPAYGQTGTVVNVSPRYVNVAGNYQWMTFFEFDRAFPAAGAGGVSGSGLLVDRLDQVDKGFLGTIGTYWISGNCSLATNTPAPGSFGSTSLRMDGTSSNSTYRAATMPSNLGDLGTGTWTVSFWFKSASGSPQMQVVSRYSGTKTVPVSGTWIQTQQVWTVASRGDTSDREEFVLTVTNGVMLVDDVVVWQNSETNGTAYRDDFVNLMKSYNAGILRCLVMGGSTLSNAIYPRLQQNRSMFAHSSMTGPAGEAPQSTHGIHEFLQLCEAVGAEPWVNVPGTLTTNEIVQFMEYLSGPTNTTWGKIRADLGHPVPWTASGKPVSIEFGNEAWNLAWPFLCGGFNGTNYWRSLVNAGKGSAYYTNSIRFTAAGQNFDANMAQRIMSDVTNADQYAIAPYMLNTLSTNDTVVQNTDPKLFQWMMAHPLWDVYSRMPTHNVVLTNGTEYAFYEFNYHTTSGDEPVATVNKFLTSRAAGVSVANISLLYLKEYGVRRQSLFTLSQEAYNGVDLWGMVLSYKKGAERFRPQWLASWAVNQVRCGDLIQTLHSTNLTQDTYGRFSTVATTAPSNQTYASAFSYGFRNGITNGLVLVNYDLTQTQSVAVVFPTAVRLDQAKSWLLSSVSYTNNNEWTNTTPQVSLDETVLTNFVSGSVVDVPPGTLRVLRWENAGAGEDTRAPTVLDFDPRTGTTNISPSSTLQITFSESVATSNGHVKICSVPGGAVVHDLAANGSSVTVNGQTLTIDPPADLGFSTGYYVLIETNAFYDLAGNPYTGISSTDTWSFVTRDIIPMTTNTLRVDFGLSTAPARETDGNWQAFELLTTASKPAVSNFSLGSSNITITLNATATLGGRDRTSLIVDGGALTYADMYRDLATVNTGEITMTIAGLRANAEINLRAWMYDYSYDGGDVYSLTDITGGRNDLIGQVTNPAVKTALPTSNTMYSVPGTVFASATGTLVLKFTGAVSGARLNGLELVEVTGDVPPVYKTLAVASEYGMSDPAPGVYTNTAGTLVTVQITNEFITAGSTQRMATGWSGTGSAPSSGTGTNVTFTLQNNSSVTWNWATNLLLSAASSPNGTISGAGWIRAGSSATLSVSVARGYQFKGWSGDIPALQTNDNPLTLVVNQPLTVFANVEASGPVATNNHRIVDFGGKLGTGYYRNDTSPDVYPALVDQDSNGTLTNDTVRAWIFSLTDPLNAPGLEFDTNTVNGVFYGGLTSYAVNNSARTLSEGMVNQNHEFYDDLNMMGLGNIVEGEKVRAFGVWFWQKQDFLNGADEYVVRFDTNSTISVHVSRYWGGVNAGRWLVRDGDQFYLSQVTFAGKTNQYDMTTTNRVSDPGDGANNPVVRTTHILHPTASLWAPYNPGGAPGTNDDYEIAFDSDTTVFSAQTFSNVTAVGFLVERKLSTPYPVASGLLTNQPMGVKWNAFQCTAVVERPDFPSYYQETAALNGGGLSIASNPVPYALWRNVFRSSQRRSTMNDLPSRTYSFERDGAMGTMRADDLAHAESEPVADISWLDAVAFCNGLSELEGLMPCYYSDAAMTNVLRIIVDRDVITNWTARPTVYWKTNAPGFRLPTATEWEQMPAGLRSTNIWEYVWHLTGTSASPAQQRTVRSWNLSAPTSSVMRFSERPWQGSPRIGFRIARNGTAAPDLTAPSGGSAAWTFDTNTVLAPVTNLTSAEVRSLASSLYTFVPLTVSLAQQAGISDTNFIPSASFPDAPVLTGFGATEIPFKLWNLVQGWGRDNGYGFNYDGDMGSMGNAPDSAVHTNMEPVTELTLYDTYAWCNAFSELMGRAPVYYLDEGFTQVYRQANLFRLETLKRVGSPNWPGSGVTPYDTAALIPVYMKASANGYRIPLPQEWALANTTDANSATDAYNWLIGNSGGKTQPVGTKLPNPVGLYDMEGNALELTWGSGKATIDSAPWRMGSHFARTSQIGKNPWMTAEFAGVGRAHVGFRVMGEVVSYSLQSSTSLLTVAEGSYNTFTVSLSAVPDGDMNVNVGWFSGDTDLTVISGSSLLFTTNNWLIGQPVVISAAEDTDVINGTAIFRATAIGISPLDITVNEADNDSAFSVTPSVLNFAWNVSAGSVTSVLLNVGFEGTISLPSGWTQQYVLGNATPVWKIQKGGQSGDAHPSTAHSGSNNACLYYTGYSNVTRLVSSVVNAGAATSTVLTFWHTQEYWSPDQDSLRVQYRTNGSAWITLATYINSIASWTNRTLTVPGATNLQISFEGTATYGYGVCLDDITLTAVSPAAGGAPAAQTFTVTNSGGNALSISNSWPVTWLDVQSVTAAVAAGQTAQFTVSMVSNNLQIGTGTSLVWVANTAASQTPVPIAIIRTVDTNFSSHLLGVSVSNALWGSANTTGGLFVAGSPVILQATAAQYGQFSGWTGSIVSVSNPVQFALSSPVAITALFNELLYTNETPASWLAQHGLPVSDAGALSDTDGDGLTAWQEYLAGTLPNLGTSVFKISNHWKTPDGSGQIFAWPAVTGRVYSVYWRSNLVSGVWIELSSNAAGIYTDTVHSAEQDGFYRVRVYRE